MEQQSGTPALEPPGDAPPGPPLASGRTADVYALPGDRVLRRYRDGQSATAEESLLLRLGTLGYPVPRVHPRAEPGGTGHGGARLDSAGRPRLGPGDLVMERLHGPTLAEALLGGTTSPERGGAVLAHLLDRLHALPGRLVHLDLHPENVISTARGPVVIDWSNAREGHPPGRDRAVSAVILAEVAVGPIPLARAVLAALLDGLARPADAPDQPPFSEQELAWAGDFRRANPTLSPAEKRALDLALELVAEHAACRPERAREQRSP
ncbi:phosphotransferase [Streptomyces triticirhizae]|uniref:Aminoglycoside phosphotransferase family protein n=1 Tax=Streptomyces triticirhizae TaxID=2483353 RepID=A0A3M2LTB9_9ACTN|nr:phosphotransferase [Streptomyces triticirhizae]RMI39823.1 aminoglycoside phosphotransferase family protein [Streptomyces triticirhizae]